MVRLESPFLLFFSVTMAVFQFLNGSIGVFPLLVAKFAPAEFQFLNGTIGVFILLKFCRSFKNISIPKWYDWSIGATNYAMSATYNFNS